jgi:hypothetical protein
VAARAHPDVPKIRIVRLATHFAMLAQGFHGGPV